MRDAITLPPAIASYLYLCVQAARPDQKAAGLHALAQAVLAPYAPTQEEPLREVDISELLATDWQNSIPKAQK